MAMFGAVVIGMSCFKLLLIHTYRSTDFEVHRNWLAVTHSLPLDQWYVDQTSPWTLDYPPLFAWFEFLLAKIAVYFDSAMLEVKNLNYDSPMTVLFQRLSVIVTDLVLAYGCKVCDDVIRRTSAGTGKRSWVQVPDGFLAMVLFTNAGLLLVDHIHFQYNGFLLGILLISIARIIQNREVEAALWFSVLLNLKHIFLYLAPAFFIYLLRSYVLLRFTNLSLTTRFIRLVKLGVVVCLVFGVSFGPFVARGQLMQVVGRLFPFRRGLSHAYWAPNFWALYNFADKMLVLRARWQGLDVGLQGVATMTGGLVQEYSHAVLPTITPLITLLATAIFILPVLVVLWRSPGNPYKFIHALVLCGLGSFMFGWHVHEKAILMVILPLGLLSLSRTGEARMFLFLSIVGHFSLFPLLFNPEETPIKVTTVLLHTFITLFVLNMQWNQSILSIVQWMYILGLVPLFKLLEGGAEQLGLGDALPFLPLMSVSVYCALGVTYCWIQLWRLYLRPLPGFKCAEITTKKAN